MTMFSRCLNFKSSGQLIASELAKASLVLVSVTTLLLGFWPDRIWSNGTILEVNTTMKLLAKQQDSLTPIVRRGTVYAIQSDRHTYLAEEISNHGRDKRLRGGSNVLFAVEGDKLYILADDQTERETRIIQEKSGSDESEPLRPSIGIPTPTVNFRDINTCKYLQVIDFSNDPYGIANELRVQAREKGFSVALSGNDIPAEEQLKACAMRGSWSSIGARGHVDMQVLDASGSLLAEANADGTAWVNARRTVRAIVAKIYSELQYTGFDENAYRNRLERQYPSRPKVAIDEDTIKQNQPKSNVEGIWTDTEDRYRLGIVTSPETRGDYVAVILRSNTPLWQPGEIKAEIRSTASPDVFTCTYFMQNKKPVGTTLTVEHGSVLRGSPVNTPTGPFNLTLVRVWPKASDESSDVAKTVVASGTGFLLSNAGFIATNWHVVEDAKNITVAFPSWSEGVKAEVVIRDKVNDLAVLRLTDTTKLRSACPELPFQLTSSNRVALGEHVSTVGFPLTPMLGSSPKFAEGVVSSKSGFQDDPRTMQISAQVQPGSSGSPLFDNEGNIVGIVVATLDAGKVFQAANAIPQNVNFAIKADYLVSLFAMIPGGALGSRTTAFSPEKAAQCVAVVRAW